MDIIEQRRVVPKRLFRGDSSPEKFISTDSKSGKSTIDQEAFRQRFMLSENNPIAKSRRGAYTSATLRTNSYYGWLEEFLISDDCRCPARVASLDALFQDPRFRKWISNDEIITQFQNDSPKFFTSPEEFGEVCSTHCLLENLSGENSSGKSKPVWIFESGFETPEQKAFYIEVFRQMNISEEDTRKRVPWCDAVASSFLDANKIAILSDSCESFDPAESSYIRDPSCIENVIASPNEWIRVLARQDHEFLFVNDLTTPNVMGGKYVHRLPMFIKAVFNKATVSLSDDEIERLVTNMGLLPKMKNEEMTVSDREASATRESLMHEFGQKSFKDRCNDIIIGGPEQIDSILHPLEASRAWPHELNIIKWKWAPDHQN